MEPNNKYPHYLNNHPDGKDLLEGKSQEKVCDAISSYILDKDNLHTGSNEDEEKCYSDKTPRIIGLEGSWGSGKSNVVKMLDDKMQSLNYVFFTYDSWGNQEDLQRRSVLELLTRELLDNKKLTGKTKMLHFDPKDGTAPYFKECTWDEKLNALLSRKSYSRNISVPSLNTSTKWFALLLVAIGLLTSILNVMRPDDICSYRWVVLGVIVFPILAFVALMICKNWKWEEMFAMYNTSGSNDTTSYVICENEPSVSEFKKWMCDLSESLSDNKLVIVFDNMDRLSEEKVHQLWSSIQTFFAGNNNQYNNIWCIVPYDEERLADAFGNNSKEDKVPTYLKQFLDKTFPIRFRIPEPVISDYKGIVNRFLHDAFGNILNDNEYDKINRCYRHKHSTPNVREIISFINKMVSLYQMWRNEIDILSMTIYILEENEILKRNIAQRNGIEDKDVDDCIISMQYEERYKLILQNEDSEKIQKGIAALLYGINPDKAYQIVLQRKIKDSITNVTLHTDLGAYINTPDFLSIFEDVMKDIEKESFAKAVQLLNTIDVTKLDKSQKNVIDNLWDDYANKYYTYNLPIKNYSYIESDILSHITEEQAIRCAKRFYSNLIHTEGIAGDKIFDNLERLFSESFAANWETAKICHKVDVSSNTFYQYIHKAGKNYKKYPITTNSDELNEYIKSNLNEQFSQYELLSLLKSDSDYDVDEIGEYAVDQIKEESASAALVYVYIQIQSIFYDTFQNETISNAYASRLWSEVSGKEHNAIYYEMCAIYAFIHIAQMPYDETHISELVSRVPFYTSTSKLLCLLSTHQNINFLIPLVKKLIKEQICDQEPVLDEFVSKWQFICNRVGVTRQEIIGFADKWDYKELSDREKEISINTLLSDSSWISELIKSDTDLSKSLIYKTIGELSSRPVSDILQVNTVNHTNTYWNQCLRLLVSTNYITSDNCKLIKTLTAYLLDYMAQKSVFNDELWNAVIQKCSHKDISSNIADIRDKILTGQQGYLMTPAKFSVLHAWLEQSDIDNPIHELDVANKILCKIINDINSQKILLLNWPLYSSIMKHTIDKSSDLKDTITNIVEKTPGTEFAKILSHDIPNYKEDKSTAN